MYWKELTTGIYPWDMHDEGIENILDNLQNHAGNNAAYMLAVMHHEKRPLHDNYYHHNPVRKRYLAEDSRSYFTIHPDSYKNSRIKPLPSERDFLKGTDWLELFTKALRKRGMSPGAEISHTPLDSVRGAGEFSDCIQRDIYGNAPDHRHFTNQQLCWNSPDARAYMCAIATDLVTHYDIDMIQTCSFLTNQGKLGIHPFLGVTLGGCFCANCEKEARKAGLDWDLIRSTVRYYADIMNRATLESNEDWLLLQRGDSSAVMFLLERPELYQWLKFRTESTTRYFKELSESIHTANSKVDFRFNTCWPEAEFIGQDLTQIGKYVDSIRIMDYAEQTGDEERVLNKEKWLSNVRRQVGEDKTIIDCIAPRAKATPDLIKKGIRTVALGGADGLSYGFYDGATIGKLQAIKEGMEECEIKLRSFSNR